MPDTSPEPRAPADIDDLAGAFRRVRAASLDLVAPLSPEDACVQSMPDASPAKWHLAHTTWFFETFVLAASDADGRSPDPAYALLFNSYYDSVGEQYSRPHRGLITRPSLAEVLDYRARIDARMAALLDAGVDADTAAVIEVGLHHERQHQELLLMDIKHLFAQNPNHPAYLSTPPSRRPDAARGEIRFVGFEGGETRVGAGGDGFSYDNERPRHPVIVPAFEIADRLVTNREYLEFVDAGGYDDPLLWLSDGHAALPGTGRHAPLYWFETETGWHEFTLSGAAPLDPDAPVAHVSFYEADAYARFRGCRLPTEFEWEHAAAGLPVTGQFLEDGRLHPAAAPSGIEGLTQMFGDLWEWTASPYVGYPGFVPEHGALGEYNGKFMSNQMVLRGGAAVTPRAQLRATYRNFFYPHTGWHFSGIRLARDAV